MQKVIIRFFIFILYSFNLIKSTTYENKNLIYYILIFVGILRTAYKVQIFWGITVFSMLFFIFHLFILILIDSFKESEIHKENLINFNCLIAVLLLISFYYSSPFNLMIGLASVPIQIIKKDHLLLFKSTIVTKIPEDFTNKFTKFNREISFPRARYGTGIVLLATATVGIAIYSISVDNAMTNFHEIHESSKALEILAFQTAFAIENGTSKEGQEAIKVFTLKYEKFNASRFSAIENYNKRTSIFNPIRTEVNRRLLNIPDHLNKIPIIKGESIKPEPVVDGILRKINRWMP